MLQMFDNAIKKVYNIVTKVITLNMNRKGIDEYPKRLNRQTRYSVKPIRKNRFSLKRRLLIKARILRIRLVNYFFLKARKPHRKRKSPSFKYILPLLLSFIVVFGAALMLSFIRAGKTPDPSYEEEKPVKIITIHYGNMDYQVLISSGVVKDAINKAGLKTDNDDEIIPSEYTDIERIDEAWVVLVEVKIIEKTVDMNFKTISNETEDLRPLETEVLTKGEKGQKKLKLKLIYKNDILVSQVLLNETIIKQPIDKVMNIGKANTDITSSD